MNGGYTFESEPFEADFETDEGEYNYEEEMDGEYNYEEEADGEYYEEAGEVPEPIRRVIRKSRERECRPSKCCTASTGPDASDGRPVDSSTR